MGNIKSYVIGIDLGGTKIYAAVVDPDGKIIATARKKTKAELGFEKVVRRIADCATEAVESAHIDFEESICAIGIGSPGPLDIEKGEIIETPNLKWKNAPLGPRLEKLLKKPVTVDNDANVGLLGEHAYGAGQNCSELVGLFIGTGVGGGVIINGKILHGYNQNAGELGHMIIDPNGPTCGCGNKGCLEAFASRTAIERDIRIADIQGVPTTVFEGMDDRTEKLRSKRLAQAFSKKDQNVYPIIKNSAYYVGVAVGSLLNIFNPQVVILGGGLVEAIGKPYVELVKVAAKKNTFRIALRNVKIVEAKLGDDSAILGAAKLGWQLAEKL